MGVDSDLAELAALTAEHLRWEMDLGSRGLPEVALDALERADEAASPPPSPAATPEPGPIASPIARPVATEAPERPQAPAAAPAPSAEEAPVDARTRLTVLAEEAASCTACRLHEGRTRSVFARGNPDGALVAFVGEGPGYHEDQQGLPFVGNAGQLLDKMIAAMGLSQDEIYVCNVVKCRPPDNRTPNPDEAAACMRFLEGQLDAVKPQVIVALGRHAAENLGVGGGGWRGRWGTFAGVRVMPTYHPAYLLRSPEQKRPVWEDLQKVVAALGRELPSR
ncbi:MAG: uracil-DNA glycosylase [Myxococcota bacterium]|nr:uracil-DNA glycosylase [Myxococcota bacterium]